MPDWRLACACLCNEYLMVPWVKRFFGRKVWNFKQNQMFFFFTKTNRINVWDYSKKLLHIEWMTSLICLRFATTYLAFLEEFDKSVQCHLYTIFAYLIEVIKNKNFTEIFPVTEMLLFEKFWPKWSKSRGNHFSFCINFFIQIRGDINVIEVVRYDIVISALWKLYSTRNYSHTLPILLLSKWKTIDLSREINGYNGKN